MITMQQFILRQPAAPEETSTDRYYLDLANRLVEIAREQNLFPSYPERVVERCAMLLVGYYQDVICDSGIWRSFILENRRLYGKTLPFYEIPDDYLDFELNREDVCFMVWYSFSMNYENLRERNPLDSELMHGAEVWWNELERVYDDSPMPEDYKLAHELEIHAEEDREAIFHLGNWLFMHCYLMTPAYALTLAEISSKFNLERDEDIIAFRRAIEESMSKDPTGPLALSLYEWLYLIIEGKLPPEHRREENGEESKEHKYYTLFTAATKGKTIKFFTDYESMNRFFIEALGWNENEEHLPQVKGASDYILMVDREKGMLLARGVAKCIAAPDNELYDKEFAKENAIRLLTVRGYCPADLVKVICENGWLPDAVFPGSTDHTVVKDNWDFIARCYLQEYYRGD